MKRHLLYVEDADVIAHVLTEMLQAEDWEVTHVGNFSMAAHLIRGNEDYHALLTDYDLGLGSPTGVEVLRVWAEERMGPSFLYSGVKRDLPEDLALFVKQYIKDDLPGILQALDEATPHPRPAEDTEITWMDLKHQVAGALGLFKVSDQWQGLKDWWTTPHDGLDGEAPYLFVEPRSSQEDLRKVLDLAIADGEKKKASTN